jgi:hypothetical protein
MRTRRESNAKTKRIKGEPHTTSKAWRDGYDNVFWKKNKTDYGEMPPTAEEVKHKRRAFVRKGSATPEEISRCQPGAFFLVDDAYAITIETYDKVLQKPVTDFDPYAGKIVEDKEGKIVEGKPDERVERINKVLTLDAVRE